MNCPCCGAQIAPADVVVSINANSLSMGWHEKPVHLPGRCADIAFVLAKKMPIPVSFDDIIFKVWGYDHKLGYARKNLHVQINTLRKHLAGTGLWVKNEYDFGYAMRRVDAA